MFRVELSMVRKPLLVTSLPPRMSRLASNGDDIGSMYQKSCIESWRAASFHPVSINSSSEDYPHSVSKVSLQRDARSVTGRPHVYFQDMLAAAVEEAEGKPFAITNSDLLLAAGTDLSDRVSSLRRGQVIFSRRIDIDEISSKEGLAWQYGYDFFAVHPDDIMGLSTDMVFGAPWWDHFFPLMLHFGGCRIDQIDPHQFRHLKHEDRWDWDVWEKLGCRFMAELKASCHDAHTEWHRTEVIAAFDCELSSDSTSISHAGLPLNLDIVPALHNVSDANLAYIDKISIRRKRLSILSQMRSWWRNA
jgi:hypothetical protein